MIYTEADKLPRLQVQEAQKTVKFETLAELFYEIPANCVYCESNGVFKGIISVGDINRAAINEKQEVEINTKFSYVKQNEYMRAREIFKERLNINSLPVIEERQEGYVLIGNFSRYDDLLFLEYMPSWERNEYIKGFWEKNHRIALVKPSGRFEKKSINLDVMKEKLRAYGVNCDVISRTDILKYLHQVDYFLFTDEEEREGTFTLYTQLLGRKELRWSQTASYRSIREAIENYMGDVISAEMLLDFQEKGIHVIMLHNHDDSTEKYKEFERYFEIRRDYMVKNNVPIDSIPQEWRQGFFDDLYAEDYAQEIINHPFPVEERNGITRLKDYSSEFYNVKDGERLTVNQPEDCSSQICFFGPCIIVGRSVEDQYTIESFLQKRCNEEKKKVKCVNLGSWSNALAQLNRVVETPLYEGDTIILYLRNNCFEGVKDVNVANVLKNTTISKEWFIDALVHCNHKVNKMIADEIYEKIKDTLNLNKEKSVPIEKSKWFIRNAYINQYFGGWKPEKEQRIGSIVMNCNPFTLGHRYLIEEALKKVDYLIVFAVEENKSVFSFEERFAFISAGVADLPNVLVVPSGQFILSQTTFPEYFLKIEDEDLIHNVEYDITLFAEHIAPALNIKYRFVGEEPEDKVTNEYNNAMKRILPLRGIEIIEIPRKKANNNYISASSVRRCLSGQEENKLSQLLPKSTQDLLFMENK